MDAAPIFSHAAIVLASASKARAALLRQAGIAFDVDPAGVDEAGIRDGLLAEKATPAHIAEVLAELKAFRVSGRHQDRLVVAADQTLACGSRVFEKPENRTAAAEQLAVLSGKTHELAAAVCVARDGAVIWRHIERARLSMRTLSPAFITSYLDAAGDSVLDSVGGYALEGLGAHLFSRIDGDYFTILGLPLLPLLDFLRLHKVAPQ